VTVTVAAGPAVPQTQTPTPVAPSPPAAPSPPPAITVPPIVAPVAPFSALTIKAKQKGAAVKGSLRIAAAGSRLSVTLTIPGKTKQAKPVTIGTLTVAKAKSGVNAFTVALDKRHGLPAQRKTRTLKVTVRVTVTPPGRAQASATKSITLTR
jgi:hypothetical protein